MNLDKIKRNTNPYIIISPAIIVVILVMVYPIVYSFIMSLTNLKYGNLDMKFIGLRNYISLFTNDDMFLSSLFLTLYFVLITILFEIILGMLIALALNRKHILGGFVKSLLVIPWALPGTIVSGMWRFIYLRDYGFINMFLRAVGLSGDINWLGFKLALVSVMLVEIWRSTPMVALLLLSGLTIIPKDLYDAASIDGANNWKIFWKITLPMMKPILSLVIIFRIVISFQTLEVIYVLTKGGPGSSTYLIPYFMYKTTFVDLRAGYGSSMAYITMFIVGIICIIYLLIFRERTRNK